VGMDLLGLVHINTLSLSWTAPLFTLGKIQAPELRTYGD
jgi:hypothetical protein